MNLQELGHLTGYRRSWLKELIVSGILKAKVIDKRGKYDIDPEYAARIVPLLRVRFVLQRSLASKARDYSKRPRYTDGPMRGKYLK